MRLPTPETLCLDGARLHASQVCAVLDSLGVRRHFGSSVDPTCATLPRCLEAAFIFAATPCFHRASSSICWSQPPACCWCGRARAVPTAQQRSRQPSGACVLCCLIPRSALPTLEQSAPSWQVCREAGRLGVVPECGPAAAARLLCCQLWPLSHACRVPLQAASPARHRSVACTTRCSACCLVAQVPSRCEGRLTRQLGGLLVQQQCAACPARV